jgi:hypothetical protein
MASSCCSGISSALLVEQRFLGYRLFVKRTDGTALSCASTMSVSDLCNTPNYQDFIWGDESGLTVSVRKEFFALFRRAL